MLQSNGFAQCSAGRAWSWAVNWIDWRLLACLGDVVLASACFIRAKVAPASCSWLRPVGVLSHLCLLRPHCTRVAILHPTVPTLRCYLHHVSHVGV
jgi:hypothetical protein